MAFKIPKFSVWLMCMAVVGIVAVSLIELPTISTVEKAFAQTGNCISEGSIDDSCDQDKDGVLDQYDQCVLVPGPAANNGCPWPSATTPPPTATTPPPSTYTPPPSTYTPPPSTYTPPPSTYTPPPSTYTPPPSTYTPPPSTYTPPPTVVVTQTPVFTRTPTPNRVSGGAVESVFSVFRNFVDNIFSPRPTATVIYGPQLPPTRVTVTPAPVVTTPLPMAVPIGLPTTAYNEVSPGVSFNPSGGTYNQGTINISPDQCNTAVLPQCNDIPVYVPNVGDNEPLNVNPNATPIFNFTPTGPILTAPSPGVLWPFRGLGSNPGDIFGDYTVASMQFIDGQMVPVTGVPSVVRIDQQNAFPVAQTVDSYTGGQWVNVDGGIEPTVVNLAGNQLLEDNLLLLNDIVDGPVNNLWSSNNAFFTPAQLNVNPLTGEVEATYWNGLGDVMNEVEDIGRYMYSVNQVQVGRVDELTPIEYVAERTMLLGYNLVAIQAQGELDGAFSGFGELDAEVEVQIQVFQVTNPDGTMPETQVRAIITTDQSGTVSVVQVLDERGTVGTISTELNVTSYIGGNGMYMADSTGGDCLFQQFYIAQPGNLIEIDMPDEYNVGGTPCE